MMAAFRSKLQPGAIVFVLYDPESPAKGRWKSNNWVWPVAATALSILVGFAGFFPNFTRIPFRG